MLISGPATGAEHSVGTAALHCEAGDLGALEVTEIPLVRYLPGMCSIL